MNITDIWFTSIQHNEINTVKAMIKQGIDVNIRHDIIGSTALMLVAQCGYTDTVRELVCARANNNAKNSEGYNALTYAIMGKHIEIVEILINHGADVNFRDTHGYVPLMYAILYKSTEMIKILIEHGADINGQSSDGVSMFNFALESGSVDVVQLIGKLVFRCQEPSELTPTPETVPELTHEQKIEKIIEFIRQL